MGRSYESGFNFFGAIAFIISWIYFTLDVGFFGFVFGWFPSLFIAGIVGMLWPLVFIGVAAIAISIA